MDDYTKQIGRFCSEIVQAIDDNNINKLIDIINSDKYDKLTLNEKESHAFISVYISYNKEMLQHLIFEYNIKENNSIEHIKDTSAGIVQILDVNGLKEEITHMFTTRRLNDELASELDTNLDKPTNKLKI
jgi:hypothetical protein